MMKLSRRLILVLSCFIFLLMAVLLVGSVAQIYTQVYLSSSPFVANLFLFLLLVLLGAIAAILFYYFRLLLLPKKPEKRPRLRRKLLVKKSEAATENLQAIKQQVDRIQDEVAKQALLLRSQEIEASLSRGCLQIVVFGTGSAGKTSVVNALMGKMVGQVAAPMGTTQVGETYSLKLKGLDREILITDTPGILEMGVRGKEREFLARNLATEANLILFVVDNDLQKSEYLPLQMLAEIGKRLIVVFNKIDRFPDVERELIVESLRQKLQGIVANLDLVSIAANPQPVLLDTGATFQLEPDLMPLMRRIATVLRAEGEDLMADNILLQSQRLGDEARKLIDSQRRRQAEKVVDRFQWLGAGAIALTPLPMIDLLATAAVNAQMVVEIGKIYECEINLDRGKELALSLAKTLASLGIVSAAIKIISTALQLNLATFLVGKAIQGISAAYLTRIAGKSFIEYFRHDQDWGDGGMTEVVQRQFELTRRDEFVKAFVKDGIARVIEPLNMKSEIEEIEIVSSRDNTPPKLYQDDWENNPNQNRSDW
jgi:small GTP-binding protein